MASRPTVLVIAVGGNVSQGILKALARGKGDCRVIGADISAEQMGLYTVDKAYVAPWAHEPEFRPWLAECCQHESVDLILSGAEPVLMELSRCRDTIEEETGALCLVSGFEVMETCDDKWQTCEWLVENGFACPPYATSEDHAASAALAEDAGFPLIAKPRRGGGARGHFLIEDQNDLDYIGRKPGYLLQARVGTPKDEYTAGCFMDRDGNLAPSCVMRRELMAGTTYRAELGDFPEVRAEAERITAALKPLGPCNVQLRMTEEGPVCFEINPRFSGTAPIRAHYGYNEADAVIGHYLLREPVQLPKVTEGLVLRYWNELYAGLDAAAHLRAHGVLECTNWPGPKIESYGSPRHSSRRR